MLQLIWHKNVVDPPPPIKDMSVNLASLHLYSYFTGIRGETQMDVFKLTVVTLGGNGRQLTVF